LPPPSFTPYQKFVTGLLAFLQFAVILDFMIMSPLGAMIMPALNIAPSQFGLVVSAYAFAAGVSSVVTAGFADRFDRKRLLLFFYAGFVLGTLWCGLAPTFEQLLAARVVTGIFGGVIGSVIMAIATDLFQPQLRGRALGAMQTAFAASQVLGLPAGVYLSNHWGWHAPFLALVLFGIAGGAVIALGLKPVADHLALRQEKSAFKHLLHTVTDARYLPAFAATGLLTTGGYMLMPFGSAFSVNNLGISMAQLPIIYLVTGIATIFIAPTVGRVADKLGKFRVFLAGCVLSVVMVLIYTHLEVTPLPLVILVNVVLFVGIFSRMIPYQAMVSSVPDVTQRGSFNAVSAALQQLAGGLSSLLAGHLVSAGPDGRLLHFPLIGYVMTGVTVLAALLVWQVYKGLQQREQTAAAAAAA
jgi:predicted MFS family arabinose efflux permease